ncbi:MAG TPA: helix-turn-helix transcriptional regulator [Anaerolineae bacterium]|nr:helix-turn-helix transcriptional regulator [Anaerolineae bacterium]HOR00273.1 helix-turn-helix transcriptional regulator [Anaerolineae bacterium]
MARKKDPFAAAMGNRMSAAMESLGLTQTETARLLGMDVNTFGSAVRGYHRLQYEVFIKLPRVLHRSLYYFLGLSEPSDVTADEQELLSYYRSYRTQQMKAALRDDARRHLEVERAILPADDGKAPA